MVPSADVPPGPSPVRGHVDQMRPCAPCRVHAAVLHDAVLHDAVLHDAVFARWGVHRPRFSLGRSGRTSSTTRHPVPSYTRDCTVHGAACRRWITSSTKVLAQVTRTRCDRPEPAERGSVTTQAPLAVAGRAPSRRPVARPSRRWPHRSTLRRQRGQQPRPDARPDTPRGMSWGRSRPVHE